jgi:hypothetical protein
MPPSGRTVIAIVVSSNFLAVIVRAFYASAIEPSEERVIPRYERRATRTGSVPRAVFSEGILKIRSAAIHCAGVALAFTMVGAG